jgi:hypothetical protein
MRKVGTLALITALLALALPVGASARSHRPDGVKSAASVKKAAKRCKALRREMGHRAFAQAFGTKRGKIAFRKCVSRRGALPEPVEPLKSAAAPCPPVEPPLPVHAFVVDPCVAVPETPLPVSPGEPASDDDADDAEDADDAQDADDQADEDADEHAGSDEAEAEDDAD